MILPGERIYLWLICSALMLISGCSLLADNTLPSLDAAQPVNPTQGLPSATFEPTKITIQEVEREITATISGSPTQAPLTSTPTPKPSLQVEINEIPVYDISAVYDHISKTLEVVQTIGYRNTIEDELSELLFVVESNLYEDAFKVISITDHNLTLLDGWSLNSSFLKVPLPDPLIAGDVTFIVIKYKLALPNQPGIFGYTQDQVNLGHWFPFIPPYDPTLGWLAYKPNIVGENLLFPQATFSIQLDITNADEALTVIAPATPTIAGENSMFFQLSNVRTFPLSISSNFIVLETKVSNVLIRSVFYPQHQLAGEAVLANAARAVELYSEWFGPYPHAHLSIVEASFEDGMEFDGFFFLGEDYYIGYSGEPKDWLVLITVHETAHMWWLGLVGSNQAIEPWLDEALATYCELLFYQSEYPDLETWWWNFRLFRFEFQDRGPVNSTIYQFGDYRAYVDTIYLRGAFFLNMMRVKMGRIAFLDGLHEYASQFAGQQATGNDFLSIMQHNSNADLTPLILQYME